LRELPRELRVLLVGQDQEGRDAETIREVARWYGVADRFSILGNQPYSAVAEMFCQARSSIVLSKREGSCVVVTESMFADTPVAVLRGAELGSRVFINDETGCFLNEATLARDLGDFLRRADNYKPRAWAELHISCHRSTQVLNGILKEHALALGQTWTQDIASLQWSPDPKLANDADRYRLATERKSIVERYGLEIGPIEAGR
jgi:glycosyltransferase involved in cell wall biosynthesis